MSFTDTHILSHFLFKQYINITGWYKIQLLLKISKNSNLREVTLPLNSTVVTLQMYHHTRWEDLGAAFH